MVKFEIIGWFELYTPSGVVIVKNDLLYKGARWLTSGLVNDLAGEGYPANAAKFIHYGNGDAIVSPEQWHLQSFVGSLSTTYTRVSDNHVRFSGTFVGGRYATEMALGLTANDPSSDVDYSNTVLDRALLPVPYSPQFDTPISYNFKIDVV
jgi:hypothetical protein